MKYIFLVVVFVCCSFIVRGQGRINSEDKSKHEFKNQGEQENYWAEQLFKSEYRKRHFPKFDGQVVVHDNQYQYGNSVLTVFASAEFKPLFEKGILYPDIMHSYYMVGKKIKIEGAKNDTAKPNAVLAKLLNTDTLSLSSFEELKFLQSSPHQKRFRFWIDRKGLANPIVYFIELTNKKATDNTTLADFINGAKLTFVEQGWVIM